MAPVKRFSIRDLASRAYRRLDSNLRARLVIPSAVLTMLVLAGMVAAAGTIHGRELADARTEREQLFAALASEAIASHMMEVGNRELRRLIDEIGTHRQDVSAVYVLDGAGVVTTALDARAVGSTPWPKDLLAEGRPFTRALGD